MWWSVWLQLYHSAPRHLEAMIERQGGPTPHGANAAAATLVSGSHTPNSCSATLSVLHKGTVGGWSPSYQTCWNRRIEKQNKTNRIWVEPQRQELARWPVGTEGWLYFEWQGKGQTNQLNLLSAFKLSHSITFIIFGWKLIRGEKNEGSFSLCSLIGHFLKEEAGNAMHGG